MYTQEDFERDIDQALALERQIAAYVARKKRAGMKCVVFPRAHYIRPKYFFN